MKIQINPETISTWLSTLPGVHDAIPGTVRIDGETFPAVRYKRTTARTTAILPGCPAYDRGERETTREVLYCVGMRPKRMRQKYQFGSEYVSKHVYTLPGDARDWYLCCYGEDIKPEHSASHPFGPSFMLSPWEVPSGEKIDAWHQEKPCIRVMVSVQGQLQ